MNNQIKIACPKCDWEPEARDMWQCSCGHIWNTFDTGGCCPNCKKQWKDTQCIGWRGGCNAWSPHIDWYRGLDEAIAELLKSIKEASEVF